jgi:hypothetical protein
MQLTSLHLVLLCAPLQVGADAGVALVLPESDHMQASAAEGRRSVRACWPAPCSLFVCTWVGGWQWMQGQESGAVNNTAAAANRDAESGCALGMSLQKAACEHLEPQQQSTN